MANSFNQFSRLGYGAHDQYILKAEDEQAIGRTRPTFTGSDMYCHINNKFVRNIESVTWSSSVEVVGDYVMGSRNAQAYRTGKRVIVGTMVFSQYDRHAVLDEVFNLSNPDNPIRTYQDLWNLDSTNPPIAARILSTPNSVKLKTRTSYGVNTLSSQIISGSVYDVQLATRTQGLTLAEFETRMQQQLAQAARLKGSTKIDYADMIPLFDLTITGVNTKGETTSCGIFGIQITQETAGVSSNDMTNSVGVSFTALAINPWKPIQLVNNNLYIPGYN